MMKRKLIILLLALPGCFPSLFAQGEFWTEKPTGLYNNTTFGIVTFRGDFLTGIQSTFGYKLNPHIAFGGGAGLERYTGQPTYDTLSANFSLLPLYAEIRFTLLDKKISPVIAVDGGYKVLLNIPSSQMISWTEETYPGFYWTDYYEYDTYTRGGFFFTVEAGVKANVWKRVNIYLSVDYSFWSVAGDHHYWMYEHIGDETVETHSTSGTVAYTDQFVVRLGFGF